MTSLRNLKNEVHIWCARLDLDELSVSCACQRLSGDERKQALQLRTPLLRAKFIVSRTLLRMLIAHLCDCAPDRIQFSYGEYGKPSVENQFPSVQFNMSHSGDIAAYAFTAYDPLGLDIEQHRPMPDLEGIAFRFFNHSDFEELLHVSAPERVPSFFDCWVRKEAYVKGLGKGLSMPLDGFQVSFAPGQRTAVVTEHDDTEDSLAWSIVAFAPEVAYSGAVAVRRRTGKVRIHKLRSARDILAGTTRL